jgi:methionyl-tRNA formyltransferase
MRIGVAATPGVAIPTLDWLIQTDHELALLITQPDRPAGRGRSLQATPVSDWGAQNQIQVFKPEHPRDLVGKIEHLDVVLTIGYGVLLPEHILSLPQFGFLNLHFSLLPAYRGAAPAQRALHNGETTTGVTVFQLDKGMDTGPIFSQRSLAIDPAWRSVELLAELANLGPETVAEALDMLHGSIPPHPQSGTATLAPKITKSETEIDFNSEPHAIVNAIRAFTYEPGAWTTWKGQPFKICSTGNVVDSVAAPGEITAHADSVIVGTGNGGLEILTVIPAGKREMSALEWARGARLSGGELFG